MATSIFIIIIIITISITIVINTTITIMIIMMMIIMIIIMMVIIIIIITISITIIINTTITIMIIMMMIIWSSCWWWSSSASSSPSSSSSLPSNQTSILGKAFKADDDRNVNDPGAARLSKQKPAVTSMINQMWNVKVWYITSWCWELSMLQLEMLVSLVLSGCTTGEAEEGLRAQRGTWLRARALTDSRGGGVQTLLHAVHEPFLSMNIILFGIECLDHFPQCCTAVAHVGFSSCGAQALDERSGAFSYITWRAKGQFLWLKLWRCWGVHAFLRPGGLENLVKPTCRPAQASKSSQQVLLGNLRRNLLAWSPQEKRCWSSNLNVWHSWFSEYYFCFLWFHVGISMLGLKVGQPISNPTHVNQTCPWTASFACHVVQLACLFRLPWLFIYQSLPGQWGPAKRSQECVTLRNKFEILSLSRICDLHLGVWHTTCNCIKILWSCTTSISPEEALSEDLRACSWRRPPNEVHQRCQHLYMARCFHRCSSWQVWRKVVGEETSRMALEHEHYLQWCGMCRKCTSTNLL